MRLRDLVANSLPRVRGRKKKPPLTVLEVALPTGDEPIDQNQNRFPAPHAVPPPTRCRGSREGSLEPPPTSQDLRWRGNALYKGMETGMEIPERTSAGYAGEVGLPFCAPAHGIVTSHSAEGFSSQLMMMSSRSFDATRMAVSEYNGSCSQMSSISETMVETSGQRLQQQQQQQFIHCHYHRHDHQYHHFIHHTSKKPLAEKQQQQQQQTTPTTFAGGISAPCKNDVPKSEPGFFRKSIASFRSMRKNSSRGKKDGGKSSGGQEPLNKCSICPYPELPSAGSAERTVPEKRPAKPKRKGLKGFSKSKNKDSYSQDKSDKSWYSDNDAVDRNAIRRGDEENMLLPLTSLERPRFRECSVETCSSRLYDSRENSCVREIDPTGFDSASLSGYESDFPRSKVRRSRSRIKTNPWLPSPQPSLSGSRRGEAEEFQESREELMEDEMAKFPRSASFDHQRSFGASSFNPNDPNRTGVQRHRSLTPSDVKMSLTLDTTKKLVPIQAGWWAHNRAKQNASASSALNDLNTERTTARASRPTSVVSPNSEFVILTDNLEQLANNISFEYEEMLDSTLESVSPGQDGGERSSIPEFLTDEDSPSGACAGNKQNHARFLKSILAGTDANNAYSPDSGVGGLGSTDGDDGGLLLTHTGSKVGQGQGQMSPSTLNEEEPGPEISFMAYRGGSSTADILSGNLKERLCSNVTTTATSSSSSTTTTTTTTTITKNNRNSNSNDSEANYSETAAQAVRHQATAPSPNCIPYTPFATCSRKNSGKDLSTGDESSTTVCESDIDNTSYQDICDAPPSRKDSGSPLIPCQTEMVSSATTLMVNERLDIQFQPPLRHFPVTGIVMGAKMSMHERTPSPVFERKEEHLLQGQDLSRINHTPKIVRPSVLKTNPTNAMRGRFNNMEKDSGETGPDGERQSRPLSEEFVFPRNITLSECVESPTENCDCDDVFHMASPRAIPKEIPDTGRVMSDTALRKDGDKDGGRITAEHLMLKLEQAGQSEKENVPSSNNTNHSSAVRPEDVNLIQCLRVNILPQPPPPDGSPLDMTDASVQTDFDEDFSKWAEEYLTDDRLDGLCKAPDSKRSSNHLGSQILEGAVGGLDPVENTRRWLLTGNMQGSADTGYSSLTRDSQILMDEDTLFLAGDLEEKAAAERLSFTEGSKQPPQSSCNATTCRNSLDSKRDRVFNEGVHETEPSSEDTYWKPEVGVYGESPFVHSECSVFRSASAGEVDNTKSNSLKESGKKAIPASMVNRMFSNIELQFEEIFNQIWGHEVDPQSKRYSNASTESTLKSESSGVSLTDEEDFTSSQNLMKTSTAPVDSETGENKNAACFRRGQENVSDVVDSFLDHDYVNVPKRRATRQLIPMKQPIPLQGACGEISSNETATTDKDSTHLHSLPNNPGRTGRPLDTAPTDIPSTTFPSSSLEEKADYLAFLKDTPLSRSHLKRPLFLVPGVGPVDMSSTEQQNVFAEPFPRSSAHASFPSTPSTETSQFPLHVGGYCSATASPSTAHVGKKMKSRRGNEDLRDVGAGNSPRIKHFSQDRDSAHMDSFDRTVDIPLMSASSGQNAPPRMTSVDLDEATRSLAERVTSLRKEKEKVYRKIQEAQMDEITRQQKKLLLQRSLHAQRKDMLLGTLHELRDKLEEQSRRLQQKYNGPAS